jgi:hypothetical protein
LGVLERIFAHRGSPRSMALFGAKWRFYGSLHHRSSRRITSYVPNTKSLVRSVLHPCCGSLNALGFITKSPKHGLGGPCWARAISPRGMASRTPPRSALIMSSSGRTSARMSIHSPPRRMALIEPVKVRAQRDSEGRTPHQSQDGRSKGGLLFEGRPAGAPTPFEEEASL